MKILHVIAPALAGGAESVVQMLTTGQRRAGTEAEIAALLPIAGPHPFVERARAASLPVTEFRLGHRHYLAEREALARHIERSGIQLVHTHVYHADVVGWLAARRSRIPVVATQHGFTDGGLKHAFYTWLDMRLMSQFDGVICVAEPVRARALREGCQPERVHLIRNGFGAGNLMTREEARAALGLGDGRFIAWVGRISHEKGADLMLDALATVDLPATVVLLGDGPERAGLEARAAASGLDAARVRFLGQVGEAGNRLRAFDVLAMSSRTEGTPIVLLEAMAARVPVVAFAVGGIPDVVGPDSAWLVNPNDPRAFGAALADALSRPDEAARRAERAAAILEERFGMAQWVARVDEVYQRSRRPAV